MQYTWLCSFNYNQNRLLSLFRVFFAGVSEKRQNSSRSLFARCQSQSLFANSCTVNFIIRQKCPRARDSFGYINLSICGPLVILFDKLGLINMRLTQINVLLIAELISNPKIYLILFNDSSG